MAKSTQSTACFIIYLICPSLKFFVVLPFLFATASSHESTVLPFFAPPAVTASAGPVYATESAVQQAWYQIRSVDILQLTHRPDCNSSHAAWPNGEFVDPDPSELLANASSPCKTKSIESSEVLFVSVRTRFSGPVLAHGTPVRRGLVEGPDTVDWASVIRMNCTAVPNGWRFVPAVSRDFPLAPLLPLGELDNVHYGDESHELLSLFVYDQDPHKARSRRAHELDMEWLDSCQLSVLPSPSLTSPSFTPLSGSGRLSPIRSDFVFKQQTIVRVLQPTSALLSSLVPSLLTLDTSATPSQSLLQFQAFFDGSSPPSAQSPAAAAGEDELDSGELEDDEPRASMRFAEAKTGATYDTEDSSPPTGPGAPGEDYDPDEVKSAVPVPKPQDMTGPNSEGAGLDAGSVAGFILMIIVVCALGDSFTEAAEEIGQKIGKRGSEIIAKLMTHMNMKSGQRKLLMNASTSPFAKAVILILIPFLTNAVAQSVTLALTEKISPDIANGIEQNVKDETTGQITRKVDEIVTKGVWKNTKISVPHILERTVPPAITKGVVHTLTLTLSRALTHILAPTLSVTLAYKPVVQLSCAYCRAYGTYCQFCNVYPDDSAHRVYIANYYAAYYIDYFIEQKYECAVEGIENFG